MNFAVDGKVLRYQPAMIFLARLEPTRSDSISSPVHALVGLHVFAHGLYKVLVRYFAISIMVKVLEQLVKLLL